VSFVARRTVVSGSLPVSRCFSGVSGSPTMEKIPVIIVGAGLAGLALGLSIAKYELHGL
jgi:ribulose 1,5-bisphosphate synthetase/thiazole synthase